MLYLRRFATLLCVLSRCIWRVARAFVGGMSAACSIVRLLREIQRNTYGVIHTPEGPCPIGVKSAIERGIELVCGYGYCQSTDTSLDQRQEALRPSFERIQESPFGANSKPSLSAASKKHV